MPALHSEISHNLEAVALRRRLNGLLDAVRVEYAGMLSDLRVEWEGDTVHISFSAYGFDIASEVHLEPRRIQWDGYVPPRATSFCGKIQRTIHHKLSEVLRAPLAEAELCRAA